MWGVVGNENSREVLMELLGEVGYFCMLLDGRFDAIVSFTNDIFQKAYGRKFLLRFRKNFRILASFSVWRVKSM